MNAKLALLGLKLPGTIDYSQSPQQMLDHGKFDKVDFPIRTMCRNVQAQPTGGIVHIEHEVVIPERLFTTAQARTHVAGIPLYTGGFEHFCNLSAILKGRKELLEKFTEAVDVISLEVFDEDLRGHRSVLLMRIYRGSTSLSLEPEGGGDTFMWPPTKTFLGYRVVRRVAASVAMALAVAGVNH